MTSYLCSSVAAKPSSSKKLPPGTTRRDVPILMKYAAPHKQMRGTWVFTHDAHVIVM